MKYYQKIKQINLIQDYLKTYPYVKPYLFRAILALVITIPLGGNRCCNSLGYETLFFKRAVPKHITPILGVVFYLFSNAYAGSVMVRF